MVQTELSSMYFLMVAQSTVCHTPSNAFLKSMNIFFIDQQQNCQGKVLFTENSNVEYFCGAASGFEMFLLLRNNCLDLWFCFQGDIAGVASDKLSTNFLFLSALAAVSTSPQRWRWNGENYIPYLWSDKTWRHCNPQYHGTTCIYMLHPSYTI